MMNIGDVVFTCHNNELIKGSLQAIYRHTVLLETGTSLILVNKSTLIKKISLEALEHIQEHIKISINE